MGVFTIKGERFIGVDSGGVNYDGTAKEQEDGNYSRRFGGAFVVAVRAMLRVLEKLDDTKTVVSSSLHSLNIEIGAARVAALPRARGPRGARGRALRGPLSLLLTLVKSTALRGARTRRRMEARSGKPRELSSTLRPSA